MKTAWLAAALALILVHLYAMGSLLRENRRRMEAREDMRRLAKAAMRYFAEVNPPTGEAFWKAIGMGHSVRDPWGSAYILERSAESVFRWRCLGRDRVAGTADDLLFPVPFGQEPEGEILDQSVPLSRDAK